MYEDLSIDELAERIAAVEATMAVQRELVDGLKRAIIERLDEQGVASTVTNDGRRVTVVRSSVSKWDTEILKDILVPLELWERVRVLREEVDESALERLVDQGELELPRLQPALTVTERKPYPKISQEKKSAR